MTHGGNIWEAAKRLGIDPLRIADFSASINPFGPSRKALKALRSSLSLIPPYPDPDAQELKRSLSAHHSIPESSILPANGSTELIHLIPGVLRPKKALIVGPAFSEYGRALKLSGTKISGFVLDWRDAFRLDEKRLARRVEGSDMVFIGNPSNPAGTALSREDVLSIAAICRKKGAILVVDEAFADFAEDVSIIKDAPSRTNVIVLRSMTKFYSMAGLRLGFAVASVPVIEKMRKHLPPWSVNTLASVFARESLTDARYIERTSKWAVAEREFLSLSLGRLRGLRVFPSSANFIMALIEGGALDAVGLKKRLIKKGLLIRDLEDFPGLGKAFFRLSLKKRVDNAALLRELSAIFGEKAAKAVAPSKAAKRLL
ncbi:MAG: threonine-phosphate decarboxylase [Deltaproteobacteria bacterium GWB2_55_19]|nr:MAG: threonine-phosphate decarboxylase [Deltaproteobacteria bacterium GWB2_55_19]HAO92571.1 threonine-phosphate decarboxylase [Deltaproteobacteria bacterium]